IARRKRTPRASCWASSTGWAPRCCGSSTTWSWWAIWRSAWWCWTLARRSPKVLPTRCCAIRGWPRPTWAARGTHRKERRHDAGAAEAPDVGGRQPRAAGLGVARARGDGGRPARRHRPARADGGRHAGRPARHGARRGGRRLHRRDDARALHHRLLRPHPGHQDADVGADFIQIDEPHHGMYHGSAHDVSKGINRAVDGVDAKIAVHVCFGNLYGRPFSAVRDYANVFSTLHEIDASQIVLEFANRGMDDAARWKDFPRDKELGAGVIDVKAFKSETPQEVAERIRALLRHVAPDKLRL